MTTKLQIENTILDPGISLRSAGWDDLEAVTQLVYDVCEADGDTTVAVTVEEMKHEWESPGFNIETDVIVAMTADGRIVGYEEFYNAHEHAKLRTDGCVHPQFKGLGIGTALMRAVGERAGKEVELAEPDVRVYIHSTMDARDKDGRNIHEGEGYSPIRYHWRMQADLKSQPAEAVLPDGIELRPFVKEEHAYLVWQATSEAFSDHWEHHEMPFDEWVEYRLESSNFDPSLWMIAWDVRSAEIAGASLNRYRMGIGWIGSLGVRRPWRKMGLGYALLTHSFGLFYKRDTKTIGLGVDAQNPTGATRLYQKAGMYAASEFVTYEKELRPGRKLME